MLNNNLKCLGFGFMALALSGCSNSYNRAIATSGAIDNIKNEDQTWFGQHENIYLGGWSETANDQGVHWIFAKQACESINNDQVLKSMHEEKLIDNLPKCLEFDHDNPQSDGLLIKFTDDYHFVSPDHFYVEFIRLSDSYVYKKTDYAMIPIVEYTDFWVSNYRLRMIASSRANYSNSDMWDEKMVGICSDIKEHEGCANL
jgi:hypothetical protein